MQTLEQPTTTIDAKTRLDVKSHDVNSSDNEGGE
jgi:hypothetical protein